MKQIKVPKEVMEVFYEAHACEQLAKDHDKGMFPSMKAVFYKARATKAHAFAKRALRASHPDTANGEWILDIVVGVVSKVEEPVASKPKAVRKPKVVAPAVVNQGEVK